VSELPVQGEEFSVVCPHCSKQFSAPVIRGATARHSGFKCPHCKLFVPFERVDEAAAQPTPQPAT
jgi:DNA-directed RNA polymerase subunit RPC12/RpoP